VGQPIVQIYYFHLRNGADVLLDPDGQMLLDLKAVIARALWEARAIIGADAVHGKIELGPRIDVEDEHGVIVHSLQFEQAVQVTRGDHP
jgi:hypothetical protein